MRDFPVSGFSDVTDRENGRAKRSRGFWNGSFLHDCGAALADRAERVQHGCADLQIQPPTMTNDLARRLEQPPAHGLHLRTLPSAPERGGAKNQIQIVSQHADGKEHRVGRERPARHVVHAKADLQILDPVLAVVAASSFSRLLAMAW